MNVPPSPGGQSLSLHAEGAARVEARLREWDHAGFGRRLWDKDYTLWSPELLPELGDRLGWLDLPRSMAGDLGTLSAFADEIRAESMRHVVLLGMGGSSLAPEVLQATFGNTPGWPELVVLDSTHPDAVRAVEARIEAHRTLFIVSSKSGTTIETLAFFRHFWSVVTAAGVQAGRHFTAITDPDTPLSRLAQERGFRRTFLAPPEVGGRYSALSVFGLVPAALIGADIERLVRRGQLMADACAASVPAHENPGLALGAALGEMALAGHDKVTFLTSPSLAALPVWIEQLLAESTGKEGRGIVPVCDEPVAGQDPYGPDRLFVSLRLLSDAGDGADAQARALEAAGHPIVTVYLVEKADLAAEFFRWEVATAAAGAVLGINPFDQPDVQLAKDLAKAAMARGGVGPRSGGDHAGGASGARDVAEVSVDDMQDLADALRAWVGRIRPGDYAGLQAYLAPTPQTTEALNRIRLRMRDRGGVATTLGYGPRFLHSTGQLHKGGPDSGIFLQIVDEPAADLPVPEADYTFGALIRAQAVGDLGALRQRGRRVLRVNLGHDVGRGLEILGGAVERSL